MRSLLYILALASCAQVTDVPPTELQGMPTDRDEQDDDIADIDPIENPLYAAEDTSPDPDETPAACEGFPTDGACSQACNPDALRSYIPAGTCATFECPHSDGSTVRVGGCVLPDE